jgi:3-deoxy-D-manno-octulosonic-acid transferase
VAGVLGNLKFDARPDTQQQALARQWRADLPRPVLMLASSREGEELEFLRQWQAGQPQAQPAAAQRVQLLIVPRHPQRFDEVARLVQAQGLTVSRRSSWTGAPADDAAALQADVWLGDSLGEMAQYYTLSDLALLGGSFEALGGQNLIEPAACGCPVVMGPHTFNFAEAAVMAEAAGAAFRVPDMAAGLTRGLGWLQDPAALQAAKAAALAFAASQGGAAARTVQALNALKAA